VVCFARCHAPADYDVYHEHCLQQHMRQCKYLGMGGQNRSGTAIHAEYTKSAAAAAAAPGGGGGHQEQRSVGCLWLVHLICLFA
jgi:hypothetical protein